MIQINARITQRLPDDLHEIVKQKADELGMSVNGYINHVLLKENTKDRLDDHEKRIIELEKQNQDKK